MLNELVKAKESIRRKYIALKSGEANIQKLMSQTFGPIIDPLTEIAGASRVSPAVASHSAANVSDISNVSDHKNISSAPPTAVVKAVTPKYEVHGDDGRYRLRRYDANLFQSVDLDKTYGPRKYSNGNIALGGKQVKFAQDTLIVEDKLYPLTPGVVNLLFLKHPVATYTAADLEIYKRILIHTSAHLTADGSKIKSGGDKYRNIIVKLFNSHTADTIAGSGLSMKLQEHNLVYWDDPNELVDRLRLLLSSREAGNTGVSNEILRIFEELLEAGLIKRIPENV